MPTSRSRKRRKPLLNWPPWYAPSIDSSLVESEDSTITPVDWSFADILDLIISFTEWKALSKLRMVSHQCRRHVDAFQLRHVVLRAAKPERDSGPEHFDVIIRSLNGRVIPAIKRVRLSSSAGSVRMHQAEARLFEMMNRHTRVVDLVGAFDEDALGHLSFEHLEYLRIIPCGGDYVSSFPFAPRTIVLFTSDLPPTPPRCLSSYNPIRRPTTKVVIVHDVKSPFDPNRYWPGLTRGATSIARNHGSNVGHLVVVFQPEAKSTPRGRLGFRGNFWASAFALEQFDEEWLTVAKQPMTLTLAHATVMAADQPRWAITLVGLNLTGASSMFVPQGHKALSTAAYFFALGAPAGRKENRSLLDSIRVCSMARYAAMLDTEYQLLLETLTAF